jgi:two-component system, OmpR family, response regulator
LSTILIAEDDDRLASLMSRALSDAGHRVDRASDGPTALAAVSSERFDLMLLDIGLPGASGIEVLSMVRRTLPALPVLLVTADNEPSHIVEGLRAGADDYITKPFPFIELVARVETRLRSVRTAERSVNCGGLTLDLVDRTLSSAVGVFELPPREFALLEYLLRHPREAIPRERLVREVWRDDPQDRSNIVDVYVRYLRPKVGPDVIMTVRGVGYRLDG